MWRRIRDAPELIPRILFSSVLTTLLVCITSSYSYEEHFTVSRARGAHPPAICCRVSNLQLQDEISRLSLDLRSSGPVFPAAFWIFLPACPTPTRISDLSLLPIPLNSPTVHQETQTKCPRDRETAGCLGFSLYSYLLRASKYCSDL